MYEINSNSIDFDIGLLDLNHLEYLNETHEKILYDFLINISEGKNDTFIPNHKLPLILDFLNENASNILNSYFDVVEPSLKNEEGTIFVENIVSDDEKLLRINFSIFFDSKKALLSSDKIKELSKDFISDAVNFVENYNKKEKSENRARNSNHITKSHVHHNRKMFVIKKDLRMNITDLQQAIKDIQAHFGKMRLFRVKVDSNNILSFTVHKAIKLEE